MSLPPPLIVKAPFEYRADPAGVGLPTSESVHGAGRFGVPDATLTLSKVEVFSSVLLCEQTNIPVVADAVMSTVTEPTSVQVDPSGEVYAVKVLPLRCSRSQAFGNAKEPPAMSELNPYWRWTALPGVTASSTYGEPAVADCLMMIPDLAHGSVMSWDVTRAVMVPSPF